jgi:hypothetical protein
MDKPSDFLPKGLLKYAKGTPDVPTTGGFRYIIQPVNEQGTTDLTKPLKRWPSAQSDYRLWYRNSFGTIKPGSIKTIQVQSDTVVVNAAIFDKNDKLDMKALELALDAAGKEISYNKGNAHIAKFCANEEWTQVEQLITNQLLKRTINVTIYEDKT